MPRNHETAQASAATVKRLNEAVSLLQKATTLLDKLAADWSVPDAPERPPAITALEAIRAKGIEAQAISKRLLDTLGS